MSAGSRLKHVQRIKAARAFEHACEHLPLPSRDAAPPDPAELWSFARNRLTEAGSQALFTQGFWFKGFWLSISSIWDNFGRLHKFVVWNVFTGESMLVGDAHGPVQCRAPSGNPARTPLPGATP